MSVLLRVHPVRAWESLQSLLSNPDDTEQALRTIAHLSGNASARLLRRFRRTPRGAALLALRPSLFDAMKDRHALRQMPDESLGRALARHFDDETIPARGLAAASEAVGCGLGAAGGSHEQRYLMLRMRDQHEIFHVLAGYRRDVRGELAVLAFTAAQTHNPGVASIPFYVLCKAGRRSEIGKLIVQGFQRGLRAEWLVDQPWEELLERPLDELRERLGVDAPPRYVPLHPTAGQRFAVSA